MVVFMVDLKFSYTPPAVGATSAFLAFVLSRAKESASGADMSGAQWSSVELSGAESLHLARITARHPIVVCAEAWCFSHRHLVKTPQRLQIRRGPTPKPIRSDRIRSCFVVTIPCL